MNISRMNLHCNHIRVIRIHPRSEKDDKISQMSAPNSICEYLQNDSIRPLFIHDDALHALSTLPSESIDCCVTSPPYWGQRQYASEGVGLETDYRKYVAQLAEIFLE